MPSNYRPTSLPGQSAKEMERCVHIYLIVINSVAIMLRTRRLTTYQLLHTYHQFCEAADNGSAVRTVFCNISKAFYRVCHKCLLHKLRGIGCSEKNIIMVQQLSFGPETKSSSKRHIL